MCEAIKRATFVVELFGIEADYASSTIAKHYREDYPLSFWAQPASEKVLGTILPQLETAWWRRQSGMAFVIGGGTPACFRGHFLLSVARGMGLLGPLPDLRRGSRERRLFYRLDHLFAGYQISGSFGIHKKFLRVEVDYLEKTAEAAGFGRLFELLEINARARGCNSVRMVVRQCKSAVVEKLYSHGGRHGWHVGIEDPGNGATGPDIVCTKELEDPD